LHSPASELSALLDARDGPARDAAWRSFVETHSRLLLHTARSMDRDYDAAMDAYAYLLEQLQHDDYRRLRAYVSDGRSKFTTWLVVVARRLCLDHLRHRYGREQNSGPRGSETREVRHRLADFLTEEIDSADLPDAGTGDPHTQLRAAELSRSLAVELRRVEPRDRLLLTLRFEDDLSAREIARLMGFPTPFHVYRRLAGVLGQLRAALTRRGVQDSEP
jgi:RNA polymerase sigma factor (sigma-70 family)